MSEEYDAIHHEAVRLDPESVWDRLRVANAHVGGLAVGRGLERFYALQDRLGPESGR